MTEVNVSEGISRTMKFSLISTIATILAAGVIVMWAIIAQPPGDTVGKAFLTVFLISGFAFAVIFEARAEHEASYVTPGRIFALLLVMASGLYLTWNQIYDEPWRDLFAGDLAAWFGTVFLIEGVAATIVLLWPRWVRNMKNSFVRYTFDAGIGLVIVVSILISFAWTTWHLEWPELFWRVVLAIGVFALVTFLIPLVTSMMLAPKTIRVQPSPYVPTQPAAPSNQDQWTAIVNKDQSS